MKEKLHYTGEEDDTKGSVNPVKFFFAWVVIVVGILLALTTGLCTVVAFSDLGEHFGYDFSLLMMVIVIGGVPCLLGTLMVYGGRRWLKRIKVGTHLTTKPGEKWESNVGRNSQDSCIQDEEYHEPK